MKRTSHNDKKAIAIERIKTLFSEASKTKDVMLANRYIKLARKIAMKAQTRFTSEQKRKICKHCHSYLFKSNSNRTRLVSSKLVFYCSNCKKYTRFPYLKEIKIKRTLKSNKRTL